MANIFLKLWKKSYGFSEKLVLTVVSVHDIIIKRREEDLLKTVECFAIHGAFDTRNIVAALGHPCPSRHLTIHGRRSVILFFEN